LLAALALIGTGVSLWYSNRLQKALDDAQRFQYFQHIVLANDAWRDGNLGRLEQLLDTCPPDYRHLWEWRHLKRQCHAELVRFEGHRGGVFDIDFSPDGKTLASASLDGSVRLWDVASGQAIGTPTGHTDEVFGVAFSPDGSRLASTSSDGTVRLWDVATGR